MRVNLISYRFYYKFEQFQIKYNLLLKELNTRDFKICEYRYAEKNLFDINLDIENAVDPKYLDFSAYLMGLKKIYLDKNQEANYINVFLNDSFFKKWPITKIINKW